MIVRFTPLARAELIEAQDWYESQGPGLGRRFRDETDRILQRVARNPRQFPAVLRNLRRARLKVFPYALFFWTETNVVWVIACFHSSRDPRHWQQRV